MTTVSPPSAAERQRRRIAHACELCRLRKTRCDGQNPCKSCVESNEACKYRETPPFSKPKNDLVIDTLLQLREEVSTLNKKFEEMTFRQDKHRPRQDTASSSLGDIASSPSTDELDATIPLSHASATEKFLSWEIFDSVPTVREQFISTYVLESQRPPMPIFTATAAIDLSAMQWNEIIDSFQRNVNFWYPAMLEEKILGSYESLLSPNLEGCLALLTVALGEACIYVEQRFQTENNRSPMSTVESVKGSACFQQAYSMIHTALAEISITSMLCLFYTAIYFSYLQRPLQTSFFLNATAHKCLILLHYSTSVMSPSDYETVKRVFWCCFILESDIVVELEKVPQSGCPSMESQIQLPSRFDTHSDHDTSNLSTLYFLACISVRRILNRIHKLLYSKESVARMQVVPDMTLIKELEHQLEEWRIVLPAYLRFEINQPVQNNYQGFLRQRYLAAKSVIFRPVFNFVVTLNLRGIEPPGLEDAVLNAAKCVDAAYLHMTNLRGYTHTVVIDTWICALSMTGVALVLYISWQTPSLRKILEEEIGVDRIRNSIEELQQKIDGMMRTSPEISPSVKQCVHMIGAVREVIG